MTHTSISCRALPSLQFTLETHDIHITTHITTTRAFTRMMMTITEMNDMISHSLL